MKKKLIEVALPLEAINAESAREKSIRHGHPSTLHLWWARRPLAACRAVLWASLVDDPSSWPDKFPTEEDQTRERQRLFDILGRFVPDVDKKGRPKLDKNGTPKLRVAGLVSWNDINDPNSGVLVAGQREIARCLAWERGEEPLTKPEDVRDYIAKYAPPAYDPFAGGGSIPLEAQRLGLEAHASDLNPVAVLINKALIEIPPKFKDQPPINPDDRKRGNLESWKGAQGLAADVRYYGKWMRDEAFKKIGHLYPKVKAVRQEDGTYRHATTAEIHNPQSTIEELTVIAWLWVRTVRCPNPACGCQMPLSRHFQISRKKGSEAWVEPVIENFTKIQKVQEFGTQNGSVVPTIRFEVRQTEGEISEGTVSRKGARCLVCETPVPLEYVRGAGKSESMGTQLIAIVAEGKNGRIYLDPAEEQKEIANSAQPEWQPESHIVDKNLRDIKTPIYGMKTFGDLFTNRQLVALSTFSDLVSETQKNITQDAISYEMINDNVPLNDGGIGARAYGEAVATYLGLALSKATDLASSLCHWQPNAQHLKIAPTFARHALPMSWDFSEGNPFSNSSGNFFRQYELIEKVLINLFPRRESKVKQNDSVTLNKDPLYKKGLISTDPPYYDNIGYADLSDFFYVWLRHSLQSIHTNLFETLLTPKTQELVATPYRFGGDKQKAQVFFEHGLGQSFRQMHEVCHMTYPMTVYYAFKQEEVKSKVSGEVIASTGWETMLEGLIKADLSICGTWPMRTERLVRSMSIGLNALASSIVLVCRPRPNNAPKITRRQFLSELKRHLPKALKTLQQGNIAPVDLAQSSIGPGMAIFSKHAAVLENNGSPMRVRTALQLINQILDEFLTEQEGEFDSDTRWALTWFEQHQFDSGPYGDAETLSKAKNTSVQGLVEAGILEAESGKVRLLRRNDLDDDWNPATDNRMPDWEVTQYLIRALDEKGETGAAELAVKLGDRGDIARDLAYRLYTLCDRKGWAKEAIAYNSLVISWPEITRLTSEFGPTSDPVQGSLEV